MKVIPWDGQPISEPGIYAGVPMQAPKSDPGAPHYHGHLCVGFSVSSGGLRTIEQRSPAHYFATSYLNPHREEQEQTEALIFGRAVHHLAGGDGQFGKHFVVKPAELNGKPWNGNRTECREWIAAVADEGLSVLGTADLKHIQGMALALQRHPAVGEARILNGQVERSIVWQDAATGVWLKARPDVIAGDCDMIVDLKTCLAADHHSVCTAITTHGYHMQLGLVYEGMLAVTGRRVTDFVLVFVEKTPPYAVAVKVIDLTDIEYGRRQLRRAIDTFARCLDSGEWPSYGDEDTPATLLPYYRKRLADEAEHRLLPELPHTPAMEPAE